MSIENGNGRLRSSRRRPLAFCYRWAIAVVGSLFFGYAAFRVLFPDTTVGQWWDRTVLRGVCAVAALLAVGVLVWWIFRAIDRLPEKRVRWAALCMMLLAGLLCILSISFFSIAAGWDYGVLLRSALELSRDGALTDMPYFSRYPFQIYPLLYLTFWMRLIHTQSMSVAYGVSYVLNVAHILFAVYGAYLFGKYSRGPHFGLKVLVLCLLSFPLFLYAPICYTDTLALPFPVWTIVLWLYARRAPFEMRRQKIRKVFLYAGSGFMAGLGLRIKSIAAIGLIALLLFLLFDHTEAGDAESASASRRRAALHKGGVILLLLAGFLIAVTGTGLVAKAAGYGELHDDRYTYPMTHWLMMGANRETVGGYYEADDLFTRSISTYAQRQEQTAKRFMERVRTDGYLQFLLDKLELMLCTGDYQVAGKLAQAPLKRYALFKNDHSPMVIGYLALEQAVQSLLLFSLLAGSVFFTRHSDGWRFRLTVMMVIGVLMFLLLWEGKARYLLFLLPVLNLAAAEGFCCLQRSCRRFRKDKAS